MSFGNPARAEQTCLFRIFYHGSRKNASTFYAGARNRAKPRNRTPQYRRRRQASSILAAARTRSPAAAARGAQKYPVSAIAYRHRRVQPVRVTGDKADGISGFVNGGQAENTDFFCPGKMEFPYMCIHRISNLTNFHQPFVCDNRIHFALFRYFCPHDKISYGCNSHIARAALRPHASVRTAESKNGVLTRIRKPAPLDSPSRRCAAHPPARRGFCLNE
jgi:hypothetical protein